MSDYKFVSAEVIEHSKHPQDGTELITMSLSFPRFLLPEFNTHRQFSRNASSSRAIPVSRLIKMVDENPVMPYHWGLNQSGMQAAEEAKGDTLIAAKVSWRHAAHNAVKAAKQLMDAGIHKQVANRLLEPFVPVKVLVSSTEWDNFFTLRNHEDAQPEIRELARVMLAAIESSKPEILDATGDPKNIFNWHLPFVSTEEKDMYNLFTLVRISAARCARVSYLNFDGTSPSVTKDIELYDKLITSEPAHASPIEHQAYTTFLHDDEVRVSYNNFVNFVQYRWHIDRGYYNIFG